MGAEVVYETVSDIHSSGHAYREELKLMLNLVKPKYFIPIHGEFRHLVKHIQVASGIGMPPDKTLLAENGDIICLSGKKAEICDKVQTGRVLVDGKGVGDVGELVLRDRRKLSGDGIVIAFLAVDEQTGNVIFGPDIISRGFIFEDEKGFILEDAKCIVLEIFDEFESPGHIDWNEVALDIKRRLKRFFYGVIERSPLILPIIIPV
jgi:ribonuclease J